MKLGGRRRMEQTVTPSYLHKLCRIPVGHATARYYPADRCVGMGIFHMIASIPFIIAIGAMFLGFKHSPIWFVLLLGAVPGVFFQKLANRFESCERLARAQLRREANCVKFRA